MKVFPSKDYKFELYIDAEKPIEQLKRETDSSINLVSYHTNKAFIGQVEFPHFKIISSAIGRGAFCVMK